MKAIYKNNSKKILKSQKLINVELGCGTNKKIKKYMHVDIVDLGVIDVVANINDGSPFKDDYIDVIYSYHFLENIFKETHRVLKPNIKNINIISYFVNSYFYSDPTHNIFFKLYSFNYLDKNQNFFKREVPIFDTGSFFEVSILKLGLTSSFLGRYAFKKVIGFMVNLFSYTKKFYEENLYYIMPPYKIVFELVKKD